MKILKQGIQVSACTPRVKEGQLTICVVKVSAQSVADALAQYGSKLTEFRSKFAQRMKLFRAESNTGRVLIGVYWRGAFLCERLQGSTLSQQAVMSTKTLAQQETCCRQLVVFSCPIFAFRALQMNPKVCMRCLYICNSI